MLEQALPGPPRGGSSAVHPEDRALLEDAHHLPAPGRSPRSPRRRYLSALGTGPGAGGGGLQGGAGAGTVRLPVGPVESIASPVPAALTSQCAPLYRTLYSSVCRPVPHCSRCTVRPAARVVPGTNTVYMHAGVCTNVRLAVSEVHSRQAGSQRQLKEARPREAFLNKSH